MAASDLQGELAKEGFQVEGDSERRLVQVVLQQLEDPSGDIQNLAVKWCRFPQTPIIHTFTMPDPNPSSCSRLHCRMFRSQGTYASVTR